MFIKVFKKCSGVREGYFHHRRLHSRGSIWDGPQGEQDLTRQKSEERMGYHGRGNRKSEGVEA